jgi:hypothetical protein
MKVFKSSIWFLNWKELKMYETFKCYSNSDEDVKLYNVVLLSRVPLWLRIFCSVRWTGA